MWQCEQPGLTEGRKDVFGIALVLLMLINNGIEHLAGDIGG
jgi:hypothetical protein